MVYIIFVLIYFLYKAITFNFILYNCALIFKVLLYKGCNLGFFHRGSTFRYLGKHVHTANCDCNLAHFHFRRSLTIDWTLVCYFLLLFYEMYMIWLHIALKTLICNNKILFWWHLLFNIKTCGLYLLYLNMKIQY